MLDWKDLNRRLENSKFTILFTDDKSERYWGFIENFLDNFGLYSDFYSDTQRSNIIRKLEDDIQRQGYGVDVEHFLFNIIIVAHIGGNGDSIGSLDFLLELENIDLLITDINYNDDKSLENDTIRDVAGIFNIWYAIAGKTVRGIVQFTGYSESGDVVGRKEYIWTERFISRKGEKIYSVSELPRLKARLLRACLKKL